MFRKLAAVSLLGLFSAPLLAAECSVDIQGNDQMQFSTNAISVDKSCKTFTVNLSHPGSLPRSSSSARRSPSKTSGNSRAAPAQTGWPDLTCSAIAAALANAVFNDARSRRSSRRFQTTQRERRRPLWQRLRKRTIHRPRWSLHA